MSDVVLSFSIEDQFSQQQHLRPHQQNLVVPFAQDAYQTLKLSFNLTVLMSVAFFNYTVLILRTSNCFVYEFYNIKNDYNSFLEIVYR